ncbi:MAG: tRNA 4-thiouridine(8) synthase ThiI [Candidatus Izimaplasma sp.]|nr:tRNA 4-thiouridine(8) synthase ThiI [Candidatus Izimaplasma bacterium]
MYDYIMIKYGDLILKGKNQHIFRRNINNQIVHKLYGLDIEINFQHDLVFVKTKKENPDDIIDRLNYISGLSSYSKVKATPFDLDKIAEAALEIIHAEIKKPTKFKIETKRADKRINYTSLEISSLLSKRILTKADQLIVDVHNPEKTLYIEARNDQTYIYLDKIPGLGGFPTSIGGRSLVMLSGGIDSPVSGYLAMNTGLEIECIHFESTPLTPIESVQKVIDLTKKLSKYASGSKIKLYLVPFKELHELILKEVDESYIITIMRRMMYRIADKIARANNHKAIISGDSIGQVASQTLESLITVQDVVKTLVIRPLATYDKNEIISLARKIDTLDISNRAFSDCCTVYVPKNPVIKPRVDRANSIEEQIDYQKILDKAVSETLNIEINARKKYNIIEKGFTVKEALNEKIGNK